MFCVDPANHFYYTLLPEGVEASATNSLSNSTSATESKDGVFTCFFFCFFSFNTFPLKTFFFYIFWLNSNSPYI